MRIKKILIFLALLSALMPLLSGCFEDSFLDTIKEEVDFIAPFDVVVSTEDSKHTTYFPVPDTGSVDMSLSGDDAAYSDTPHAINLEVKNNVNANGDDIVEDHVTGLTWTRCTATGSSTMDTDDDCDGSETDSLNDPALLEWADAINMCKNLSYGGHKDWRLPRLSELLSIANYGYHPAIDPSVFPNNRGDFEVYYYTDKHYSFDDRTRYAKVVNPVTGAVSYTAVAPGDSGYTSARFLLEEGEYVFNEEFLEIFKEDDSGPYIREYIPTADYDQSNRYKFDDPGYTQDNNGSYYKLGTRYILLSIYKYDAQWGFGFYSNAAGTYTRIYINDNETHYNPSTGVMDGSSRYVRLYTPDFTGYWDGTDYNEVPYPNPPSYQNSGIRKHYSFDGSKFVENPSGAFVQKFDSPVGYWTSTIKVLFDSNADLAEYGWIVYFQSAGVYGVNIANYQLFYKGGQADHDVKQFVRCVRGGYGDYDNPDY